MHEIKLKDKLFVILTLDAFLKCHKPQTQCRNLSKISELGSVEF